MKPPQFILTQTHFFEEIQEDFQSDTELSNKYPNLYYAIIKLADHIGLDLAAWQIKEGYIVDDFYEISYELKQDSNVYFMITGDLSRDEVLNMDFEMSRDVSTMFEIRLSQAGEYDED
jgi:hypothetical protein